MNTEEDFRRNFAEGIKEAGFFMSVALTGAMCLLVLAFILIHIFAEKDLPMPIIPEESIEGVWKYE